MPSSATGEVGQALIEFALILPLLLLLSLGTMEVAFYIQQQSALNGAAFMAARTACVLNNNRASAARYTKAYGDEAGWDWLSKAINGMHDASNASTSNFTLKAKTDKLTGVIQAFSKGSAKNFDTLTAQAALPMEYNALRYHEANLTAKRTLYYLISYENTFQPPALIQKASAIMQKVKTPMVAMQAKMEALKKLLASQSAPSGAPAAPGKGGGKAPGGVPAPPAPVQIPALPDLGPLIQLAVTGEPYESVGAIMANPHKRRNTSTGVVGQNPSERYVKAGYESDQQPAAAGGYKVKSLSDALGAYANLLQQGGGKSQGGAFDSGHALGVWNPPLPPGPAIAVKAAIDVAKHQAGQLGSALAQGTDSSYKGLLAEESQLYR